MTRFARAKGSKASNERREEEATPWHVMRQQLAAQLSNNNHENNNAFSYNLQEILIKDKNDQQVEVWSDFGETKSKPKEHSDRPTEIKKKKKKKDESENIQVSYVIPNDLLKKEKIKESIHLKGKVKLKVIKKKNEDNGVIELGKLQEQKIMRKSDDFINEKRKKSKTFEEEYNGISDINKNSDSSFEIGTESNHVNAREFVKKASSLSKIIPKKSKLKDIKTCKEVKNNDSNEKKKNVFIESKSVVKFEKPKFSLSDSCKSTDNFPTSSSGPGKSESSNKKFISNKLDSNPTDQNGTVLKNSRNKSQNNDYKSNKGFQNNKRTESCYTILANGREIKVVRFDGFLVKKDDADELKKLRKRLIAEKLPKDQINKIMKLERRKAEKSLTREKKKVCFHCRKFGHNFSDCPDINDSELAKSGLCFKCGSLEHSYFQCKVLQNQEFRHAICFVCGEQGHIARQCPLNSQGQYPKGGSCHLCGENTHLRKDCPKAHEEKTSKSFTVETLNSGHVEDISDSRSSRKENELKKKKVIKFK